MRSSKSRSRSKSNRTRSMGNIVNRVFDSSGPEGKVRGTPQQIIEKYHVLARDAQLANDRVAEQNFLQHAEHYTRMLGEAQREMAREQESRREQQEAQHNNRDGGGRDSNRDTANRDAGGRDNSGRDTGRDRREREEAVSQSGATDVIDLVGDDNGSGLVETPEQAGKSGRSRRPMFRTGAPEEGSDQPAPEAKAEATPEAAEATAEAQPEAEAPAKKPRKPRAPRKPRKAASESASDDATPSDPQTSAAE
ncbi:DUF4167 domain-containing protein [Acidimangrovimonas pyrenivorans]|uniref:DUF4167 domain-containing protein n=1 Tax=Acidimangrovimonas pyrenivorans TaxID=2030798 RepID=A0ABV7AC83_9RHOB